MKKYKKLFIMLLIILILFLILLFFEDKILGIIYIKQYESKYKDINLIEKTLSFDTSNAKIEENNININDFQVILSDLIYNKDEKKLDFNLKFENKKSLNNVGYILRVYNTEYCLGDRFNGQISLGSAIEYIISYNKFYEENFGNKNRTINMSDSIFANNDLLNKCNMVKYDELLEDGNLIHKISFELPNEFIINNTLKIELFDLNYQNIGDKTIYQVKEPLTQLKYTINFSEN